MEGAADPLLEAIASVVERLSDGGHCVLIGVNDHGAASTVVAPSLPPGLRDDFSRMVTEMTRESSSEGWTHAVGAVAAPHGYKSCWATTAGHTVLALLYDGARPPGDDDSSLLARFGPLVDVAIAGSQVRETLARQALHDPLTDLPNRTLFVDRLAQAIGRLGRSGAPVAVLFLDLDRFKVVNDSLGHAAGDRLLQTVAQRLSAILRPGDTAARFGGDEFTLLCENINGPETAVAIAERVADALRQPIVLGGTEIVPTTSVGIALTADPAESPEVLIRNADAAMYTAKEHGRARFELFDEGMRARALERLELESALRRALDRGELQLVYQPTIELRSGRITGVEALLRWDHAERGRLEPAQFLTVADDTGLIIGIGRWALAEACTQAAAWWRALGHEHMADDWTVPLTLRVNVSARQFAHPQLVDDVQRALADAGMPAAGLCIEVTEEALTGGGASATTTLSGLKELGVRVAVDDFGTGSSSLQALTRFPVDALKIDESLVAGLGREMDDTTVVGAVVNLAHSLGLDAVAEGVETAEQLAALRELGCDDAQGRHLAPPMAAADVEALLIADPRY